MADVETGAQASSPSVEQPEVAANTEAPEETAETKEAEDTKDSSNAPAPDVVASSVSHGGSNVITEFFAAIVITFAQVPACVAFAALARVPPIIGLHAAWLVALPCALFGGRPGMIVGSAGALASVTRNFMGEDGTGIEILFASIMGAGLICSLAGSVGLGTYIGYVPAPVMVGFCNGLAIVIGLAQQEWFQHHDHSWLEGKHLYFTIIHAVVALLIVMLFPRFKETKHIPAHLTSVLVGLVLEWGVFRTSSWASPTTTVGESFSIEAGFPKPFFLDSHYDTSKISHDPVALILQTTTLAVVMSLEALLTTELVNDIADDEDVQSELAVQTCCGLLEQSDRQLVALGLGNIIAGFLGTMGGTALIELSVMNVHAGGKTRISSTLVPLFILAIILIASPVLKILPTGVLAGILIDAVLNTAKFESIPAILCCFLQYLPSSSFSEDSWNLIHYMKYTLEETFIVILVTAITFWTNLAYGVAAGVAVRAAVSGLEFVGAETHRDEGAVAQDEASRLAREIAQTNYGLTTRSPRQADRSPRGDQRQALLVRASAIRAPPRYSLERNTAEGSAGSAAEGNAGGNADSAVEGNPDNAT